MKLEAENSALQTSENELTELISHLRIKLTTSNEELRRSKHVENSQSVTADKVCAKLKFLEDSANSWWLFVYQISASHQFSEWKTFWKFDQGL